MGHYVSFVIQSWQDGVDGTMRWRVHCVREQDPLRLPNGSFVIRTWIDDEQIVRGLIRHVQSGREMQFQSGKSALEFIHAWLNGEQLAGPGDEIDLAVSGGREGPIDG
jgi:hypothetical protein